MATSSEPLAIGTVLHIFLHPYWGSTLDIEMRNRDSAAAQLVLRARFFPFETGNMSSLTEIARVWRAGGGWKNLESSSFKMIWNLEYGTKWD